MMKCKICNYAQAEINFGIKNRICCACSMKMWLKRLKLNIGSKYREGQKEMFKRNSSHKVFYNKNPVTSWIEGGEKL